MKKESGKSTTRSFTTNLKKEAAVTSLGKWIPVIKVDFV
jgi:hypothetical protein